MHEEVITRLRSAIGQVAWSAVAGPRGDYVMAVELGEKLRRAVRLSNPALSFVHRTFEGSHRFLIECPWRLDGPNGVVTASSVLLGRSAPISLELAEIQGRAIEDLGVEAHGADLLLCFEGGFVLRGLSIEVGDNKGRNNWSYWSPDGQLVAGPSGRISFESRGQAEAKFRRLKKVIQEEEPPLEPVGKGGKKRRKKTDPEDGG